MNTLVNIIVTIILFPWPWIVLTSPMLVASPGFSDKPSLILTTILIFLYPVLIFLILKWFGLKFYGTGINGWLIGSSLLTGAVIVLYGLPGMLFNLKRGIPNSGYFSNDRAVYVDGRKIKGADPLTFSSFEVDRLYARDEMHVFYHGKKIEEADPETFAPVNVNPADSAHKDQSPLFWRDHTNVYYAGQKITGADASTFVHLKGLYAKDRQHVYYQNIILQKANPTSFTLLGEGIATDGSAVFVYQKRTNTPIDLASFKVIDHEITTYCRDKDYVYLLFYAEDDPLVKAEGIDPETFTPLQGYYAVDKDHVYYYGGGRQKLVLLEGANPSTFSVGYDEVTGSEAGDGTLFYRFGKRVKQ